MSVYNGGSAKIKVGSAEVKGNNTSFTTYVSVGNIFKLVGESVFYTVAAITNSTSLTLSSRYANTAHQTARVKRVATAIVATKIYSGILANIPVIQSRVTIRVEGKERFRDNGAGVLTGSLGGTGTVGYDDGAWRIVLGAAVSGNKAINASYYSGDTLNSQSYQIVKDYTTYFKFPEADPVDKNLSYIYTKAVRMIDEKLSYLGIDANSYSSLAALVAAIGSSDATILIRDTQTISADLTIPSNINLLIEKPGLLSPSSGKTITIYAPSNIIAQPNQQIFTGAGSVVFSKAGTGYPSWFGCVGDGSTEDSANFQKLATSLAAGSTIDGAGLSYKIKADSAQFTTLDMHYLGINGGVSVITSGYWYGVKFNSQTTIQNCNFLVYSAGFTATVKQYHALAFGTSGSSPRHKDITVKKCSFKWLVGDVGTVDIQPFLAVGVDNIKFIHNTVDSSDSAQNIGASVLFDCNDVEMSHNYFNDLKCSLIVEFCNRIHFNYNRLWNCRYVVDADKRNKDIEIIGNTYDRSAIDTGDDYVFELNGQSGAVLMGNTVNNAHSYAGFSFKANVWDTWAMVLAQAGTSSMTGWSNIVSKGNKITNTYVYGIVFGSNWTSVPHDLTECGGDAMIEDTYENCWTATGGVAYGVIHISEGRRVKINSTIKGGDACGIRACSYLDSDVAGATTYSDLEIEIAGQIEDTKYPGILLYRPGKAVLKNPTLLRCGETSDIAMLIQDLNSRSAIVTGSVRIEEDSGTVQYGLRIYEDDWTQGNWLVKLDDVYINGHDALKDVYLSDTGVASIDSANVWLSGYIANPQVAYFINNGARAGDGSPAAVLVPRYPGEMVWDYTNSDWYIATGTLNTDWVNIT